MTSRWDRLLQSCVCIANSVYWRRDHCSYRVVDGMQMGPDDYRAAGCMRLVRAAPSELAPAASLRPRPLVVVRGGIAPLERPGAISEPAWLTSSAPRSDRSGRDPRSRI
jgi:hypothetical protein